MGVDVTEIVVAGRGSVERDGIIMDADVPELSWTRT
jgi:hypothetical protein